MDTLKAVARYNAQIHTKAAARYESLSSGRPLYTSFRAVARYKKKVAKRPPAIESSRSGRPLQKKFLKQSPATDMTKSGRPLQNISRERDRERERCRSQQLFLKMFWNVVVYYFAPNGHGALVDPNDFDAYFEALAAGTDIVEHDVPDDATDVLIHIGCFYGGWEGMQRVANPILG